MFPCLQDNKPAVAVFTDNQFALVTTSSAGTMTADFQSVSAHMNGRSVRVRIQAKNVDIEFADEAAATAFSQAVARPRAGMAVEMDRQRGYVIGAGDQVVKRCQFAGGAFIPLRQGQTVDLVFREDGLEVFGYDGDRPRQLAIALPFSEVFTLELSGPGKVTTGGGFVGGGLGLVGAAEGIAIAAFLNAVTTRTKIISVVQVGDDDHEGFFVHTEATPEELRRFLSPTFVRLRQQRPAPPPAAVASESTVEDLVSRLERLAVLHRSGALTEEEFAAAKKAAIEGR